MAEATAAAQGPLEASRAFLPSVRFDIQGVRSTDPVAAFGMKLRQENFAMDDLTLDALNRPNPYSGFSTSVMAELPILAPEGLFGYAAARRGAAARSAGTRRAAGATTFFVTKAYWDAQLAARRVETLQSALEAAHSHSDQAEALRVQGMVTGLDARLARIGAAAVETQLIAATAQAENAVSALKNLLALPDSVTVTLTDSLVGPSSATCESGSAECDIQDRGDLEALRLGSAATAAMVKSAWAKNLPAVALFGTAAHHGRTTPFGTGSGDWTIGIGLQWNVFSALSGIGAVRRANAEHDATLARHEAAERQAMLEVTSTERMLEAATERVAVAEAADVEGVEALEQARLRYRTGTSSITELLDVQSAATAATLQLLEARRDLFVALAALDLAYGVNDR
ncbi:MAG: TolC family protein [Planctomycetes bacterium]|nr:TolC family protein [Planctomycetota bacterium]